MWYRYTVIVESPAPGPNWAKPQVLSFANGLAEFAMRPHPDCKPGERTMTISRSLYEDLEIIPVDADNTEIAVSLLHRFFQEEGFPATAQLSRQTSRGCATTIIIGRPSL